MKRGTSKVLLGVILSLSVLLWGNFSGAVVPWWQFAFPEEENKPLETTPEKIVTDKDSYDRKDVSIIGFISNLKFKTFTGGYDYTTFVLVGESGGRINVFIWGRSDLRLGLKVRATGLYRKMMRAGNLSFRNVIEAKDVTKL
jgi:hypothetical protein